MTRWLIVVLALASSPALACQFDADCDIGSKCLKQSGQTDGVCTSARKPGHADDGGLSRDPTDPAKTSGNGCAVDLDCGPIGKCLRATGQVNGTCAGGGGIHISH